MSQSAGLNFFAARYTEAREHFLAAAHAARARITSMEHATQRGPEGEQLYLDVAVAGDPAAPKRLVVSSGTHGIEGYSGSAVQAAWLSGPDPARLPADTAVVLLHGINPWGFAHRQRTTEENVDLNRNFIDHGAGCPANPGYAVLHPSLVPGEWTEASVAGIFDALDAFRARVGEQAFSDAYNGGQYDFPDGVFYGGRREQWGNRAFRMAISSHVAGAKSAALIDLHTGIGGWGEHVFLCFHPPGSAAWERAKRWWGDRAVNRQGSTHKALAVYKGLLIDAFIHSLPGVETTATVIEFGTRSRAEMQKASLSLCWLRRFGERDPVLADRVRSDYIEAFYPSEPAWRASVLKASEAFLRQGITGLAGEGG